MSHPSWVRGLKYLLSALGTCLNFVAPFMGAWIEIREKWRNRFKEFVAPFTGAWIEINQFTPFKCELMR